MAKQLKQDTWRNLNVQLQDIDEKQCEQLLKDLLKAKQKKASFIFRVHSKLNRLRIAREREELMQKIYKA